MFTKSRLSSQKIKDLAGFRDIILHAKSNFQLRQAKYSMYISTWICLEELWPTDQGWPGLSQSFNNVQEDGANASKITSAQQCLSDTDLTSVENLLAASVDRVKPFSVFIIESILDTG